MPFWTARKVFARLKTTTASTVVCCKFCKITAVFALFFILIGLQRNLLCIFILFRLLAVVVSVFNWLVPVFHYRMCVFCPQTLLKCLFELCGKFFTRLKTTTASTVVCCKFSKITAVVILFYTLIGLDRNLLCVVPQFVILACCDDASVCIGSAM